MPNITKLNLSRAVESGVDADWISTMSSDALHRPRMRPTTLSGKGKIAAVVLLVFPSKEDGSSVILTKRPDNLRNHPGQISFPGGQQEGTETLAQTAVRESHEEIGIEPKQVEIVGQLNNVYIPPSDFTVTPFVGWIESRVPYRLQMEEVAEVIEAPLAHLLNDSSRTVATVQSARSGQREVPCFRYLNHEIWGATAIMLDDLLCRLNHVT